MSLKTTFVVQAFELKRKRLVPGAKEIAPTESGALKKARTGGRSLAPIRANKLAGAGDLDHGVQEQVPGPTGEADTELAQHGTATV